MMIVDAFSTLAPDHPADAQGDGGFIVAPPTVHANARGPVSLGAAVARLEAWGAANSRVLGGLIPWFPGWEGFDKALAGGFFKAILLSPDYSGPYALASAPLSALERHPETVVMIDCGREGFSRPDDLAGLLHALPPRPVVLTHGGQLCISGSHLGQASELFEAHPHTYLETSGIYRQDFLEDQLKAIGAGRILYGSAFPRMDPRLEIERPRILPVGEAERAAMLGGNAARLLGLAG